MQGEIDLRNEGAATGAACSNWSVPAAQDERKEQGREATATSPDAALTQLIVDAYAERAARSWRVAETIYSAEELARLPASVVESALGLGNPVRDARLQPGEIVLDVGCGTGIDLLLASPLVGKRGKVIGLDLTLEMIERAREHVKGLGLANVELILGPMEDIPLPDASVDLMVSNGVFNLSSDKGRAFAEAYRVLRPGGQMMVADMLLVADLPAGVLNNPKLWSG